MRLLTIALLCGCGIDPFETPSAYDGQHYLCEDPELLEQAAADCRDTPDEENEGNCTGVISFQGQIQHVPIRVDTTLQRSFVRVAQSQSDGRQYLSRVEISGAAPYFHFDTAISSIGAPWADELTEPFTVAFDIPNPDAALDFKDGHGAVQWYIRAGSDTAMLSSNADTGTSDTGNSDTGNSDSDTITVTKASAERVDLQFGGEIGPVGDTLDACAIVFPQGGVEIVPIK